MGPLNSQEACWLIDGYHSAAIHCASDGGIVRSTEHGKLHILRLLLRESDIEPELGRYVGSGEGFLLLQQHVHPLYYNMPLEQRFEMAISLSETIPHNAPETVKTALGEVPISSAALRLRASNGRTLLHAVASSIGTLTTSMHCHLDINHWIDQAKTALAGM